MVYEQDLEVWEFFFEFSHVTTKVQKIPLLAQKHDEDLQKDNFTRPQILKTKQKWSFLVSQTST